MLRIINNLGDRLLGFVAPKATASALDCGSIVNKPFCVNGYVRWCRCWTNSNCACGSCWTTTTSC